MAAYSDNEAGLNEVFDTNTLKTVKIFKDENLMSEIIIFINERELIVSGFGDKIVFRSLDESF